MISNTKAGPLDRIVATVVNGVEVARYGGLRTDEDPAPFDVVTHKPVYRLRRYFPDDGAPDRAPVLLVPPLMQVAEVWDISPSTSAVRMLNDLGVNPWVVDFGDPETEPGGSDRTFSDHVLAVAEAARTVAEIESRDVFLGGYSQGGMFCYMAAAYLRSTGVAGVVTLGSPVRTIDVEQVIPQNLMWDLGRLNAKVLSRTGMPRWAVTQMFNWMTPHKTIRNDIEFLLALHDRESLLPREPQRKFLKEGAWIAWSGPAIEELVAALADNRFMEGGMVIGDRTVSLSDLTRPILVFIGENDVLGPAPAIRSVALAAPKADVHECVLPVGHFGLPVSSHAKEKTWPGIAAWTAWVDGRGDLPDYIDPIGPVEDDDAAPQRGLVSNVTYGLGLAAQVGLRTPGTVIDVGKQVTRSLGEFAGELGAAAPRLIRLESMGPRTRVSYGRFLADQTAEHPGRVAFLHADRAYTNAESSKRVDAVVRGLLSVGVRRGDRVGLLMEMRPSALVALAALSRIGAVAVLHRPGPDLAAEAARARIGTVVADPDNATAAAGLGVRVLVLGGVRTARTIPDGAVDLELIDPDTVIPPSWFRPDPGRASDVAFVLFTGTGDRLRADHITNGRWASSALAAASACALTENDTMYSTSPLHHPSGLLLAVAATTGAGCRFALGRDFDPETFWSEVRRYRATVVTYTHAMLAPLAAADPQPGEREHSIRAFVGSGMPTGLWHRVNARFAPARVIELYASTRSGAMLANVSGRKVGSVGRPLPGTPRVNLVRTDNGDVHLGSDGLARRSRTGEVGQLLVDATGKAHGENDIALRGLFSADDAWIATGDLFRIDDDGDLWFVESAATAIDTDAGRISLRPAEDAIDLVDGVDLAAGHALRTEHGTVAAVAVTALPGATIDPRKVRTAVLNLPLRQRPALVHLIDEMPLTAWFRPAAGQLARREAPVRVLAAGDGEA